MIRKLITLTFLSAIILIGVFAIADWAKAIIYTYEDFDSYEGGEDLAGQGNWSSISGSRFSDIEVTLATDNIYVSDYKSVQFASQDTFASYVYYPFSSVGSTANVHYFDFDFKVASATVAAPNGDPLIYFQTVEGITACFFRVTTSAGDIMGGGAATTTLVRIHTDGHWHHATVKINNELNLCQYGVQDLTTGEFILTPSINYADVYSAYSALTNPEIGIIRFEAGGAASGFGDYFWIDNLAYSPVNTSGETVALSFLQATSSASLYQSFVNFASSSFPILTCSVDGTWGTAFVKETLCHIKNGIMDLMRTFFVPPQFTLDMFKESIEGFRDVFPMSVLFEAMDSIYYGLAISETDSGLTLPTLTTAAGQTVFPGYTFVSTTTMAAIDSSAYSTYRTIVENVIWISLFIGIIGIII